uniref:Beta-defensin-like domain-containing protein n=1 Tax=Catharus ustulatus TaxID=91951 RepID=A0A8C3U1E6_CATUS
MPSSMPAAHRGFCEISISSRAKGMGILVLVFIFISLPQHAARGLSDTQQCRSSRGHCRRLCFHMERWEGSCSNGRLRCCR